MAECGGDEKSIRVAPHMEAINKISKNKIHKDLIYCLGFFHVYFYSVNIEKNYLYLYGKKKVVWVKRMKIIIIVLRNLSSHYSPNISHWRDALFMSNSESH